MSRSLRPRTRPALGLECGCLLNLSNDCKVICGYQARHALAGVVQPSPYSYPLSYRSREIVAEQFPDCSDSKNWGVLWESFRQKIGSWSHSDAIQKDQCRTDRR